MKDEMMEIIEITRDRPYRTTIALSCYEIANLRQLLRYAYHNLPQFNNGDWFGEVAIKLVNATNEVKSIRGPNASNMEGCGATHWDDGKLLPEPHIGYEGWGG